MTEEHLRNRLHATADTIERSPVPLSDIRAAGRTIARRRTRARVVIGCAAGFVAVAAVAVVAPTVRPDAVGLGPATASPTPDTSKCAPGLIAVDGSEPACVSPNGLAVNDEPWPGPGGLQEALKVDLLSADAAQRRAVEDNQVSRSEYRRGFERYRACLADEGHELVGVQYGGLMIDFGVPDAAVVSGVDEVCYMSHFAVVDQAWQMPRADLILEATTLRVVNVCLERADAGSASSIDRAEHIMRDAGLSDEDCGLSPGQLEAARN